MTISPTKALDIYKMKLEGFSNTEIMKKFKISYSELQGAISYWEKRYEKTKQKEVKN